jgi:putative cofactor-binding repeat protein
MGVSILVRAGLGAAASVPGNVITVTSWLTTV